MFRTYGRFTTSEQILFTSLAPQLIDFLVKSLMTPSAPSDSQCFLPSKIGYQGGGFHSKYFQEILTPYCLNCAVSMTLCLCPQRSCSTRTQQSMTSNPCLACNRKLQMKGFHELIAVFLEHFTFEKNQKNFVSYPPMNE